MVFLGILTGFAVITLGYSLAQYFIFTPNRVRWYLTLAHLWGVAVVLLLAISIGGIK